MPRKVTLDIPDEELNCIEKRSGLCQYREASADGNIATVGERIRTILGVLNKCEKEGRVIFFVMYDIESNKVRRYVVKYLEQCGCHRVQKSIFLADLSAEKFQQIKSDLAAVQSMYENNDSIMIAQIPVDCVKGMSIIGQNIDMDLIIHSKNTLFF